MTAPRDGKMAQSQLLSSWHSAGHDHEESRLARGTTRGDLAEPTSELRVFLISPLRVMNGPKATSALSPLHTPTADIKPEPSYVRFVP
jgi:hypothetical protein